MVTQRKRNDNTQVNPSAVVMIYNYRDRLGAGNTGASDEQEIDQVVLHSASLKSVKTSKSKSQPAGTFEMELAPTKNWVTAITPGSWCVILMGRTPIAADETKYFDAKVKKEHFKMLGRIESVRVANAVDQLTGAITTTYIVTGTDWGSIFNSFLYVDPASRTKDDTAIGAATRLLYDQVVTTYGTPDTQVAKFNSTNAVRAILAFWGIEDEASSALSVATQDKTLAKALNQFAVPEELASYMGFTDKNGFKQSNKMTEILRTRTGKLRSYDSYTGNDSADEGFTDGIGYIEPRTIFGTNTVWQLLTDNCNKPLNELVADVRFEGEEPLLTIYKRIKPFKINEVSNLSLDSVKVNDNAGVGSYAPFLNKLASDFKNIRRHEIPKEDVISVNAGTNWRDRYNFVEINFGRQIIKNEKNREGVEAAFKKDLQFFDHESIRRDGLMPLTMNMTYIPPSLDGEGTDFKNAIAYKYLAKEWYFNTHKMLNGVLTMVGQDSYIGVGDNILVPAEVVAPNFNYNLDSITRAGEVYLLAHVENISHTATISNNGARSFVTEIQFVRGIISTADGDPVSFDAEQTLDQDTGKLTPSDEKNADRVFGTSSGAGGRQDPDKQKLRGT